MAANGLDLRPSASAVAFIAQVEKLFEVLDRFPEEDFSRFYTSRDAQKTVVASPLRPAAANHRPTSSPQGGLSRRRTWDSGESSVTALLEGLASSAHLSAISTQLLNQGHEQRMVRARTPDRTPEGTPGKAPMTSRRHHLPDQQQQGIAKQSDAVSPLRHPPALAGTAAVVPADLDLSGHNAFCGWEPSSALQLHLGDPGQQQEGSMQHPVCTAPTPRLAAPPPSLFRLMEATAIQGEGAAAAVAPAPISRPRHGREPSLSVSDSFLTSLSPPAQEAGQAVTQPTLADAAGQAMARLALTGMAETRGGSEGGGGGGDPPSKLVPKPPSSSMPLFKLDFSKVTPATVREAKVSGQQEGSTPPRSPYLSVRGTALVASGSLTSRRSSREQGASPPLSARQWTAAIPGRSASELDKPRSDSSAAPLTSRRSSKEQPAVEAFRPPLAKEHASTLQQQQLGRPSKEAAVSPLQQQQHKRPPKERRKSFFGGNRLWADSLKQAGVGVKAQEVGGAAWDEQLGGVMRSGGRSSGGGSCAAAGDEHLGGIMRSGGRSSGGGSYAAAGDEQLGVMRSGGSATSLMKLSYNGGRLQWPSAGQSEQRPMTPPDAHAAWARRGDMAGGRRGDRKQGMGQARHGSDVCMQSDQ